MSFIILTACLRASIVSFPAKTAAAAAAPPAYLLDEEVPFYSPVDPTLLYPNEAIQWPPVSTSPVLRGLADKGMDDCALRLAWEMRPFTWSEDVTAIHFAQMVLPDKCNTSPKQLESLVVVVSCMMTPGYPDLCYNLARSKDLSHDQAETRARFSSRLAIASAADSFPEYEEEDFTMMFDSSQEDEEVINYDQAGEFHLEPIMVNEVTTVSGHPY